MTLAIDVEDADWNAIPGLEELARSAVAAAFASTGIAADSYDASILFTDDRSIAALNAHWRNKTSATNVLSFPASGQPVPDGETQPLGDIVLASGVVAREAAEQGKTLPHHTMHLIIHGVLHLLGYDHEDDSEAEEMERLEAEILKGLGISDPYERQ